jgi:putative ABC transport system permease protein
MLVALDTGILIGLIFAWAVLGLTLSFRLLSFPDITIEGSLLLGSAVYASLLNIKIDPVVGASLAIVAGGTAGAVTGLIHTRFKVNKFLAGILVVAMAYTVSLRSMGRSNIGLSDVSTLFDLGGNLNTFSSPHFHLGSILILFVLLALTSAILYMFFSSRTGLGIRVASAQASFAQNLGLHRPIRLIAGLFITNCLAAMSGVLLTMQLGFADINSGQGVLVLGLAAMTIGERLLPASRISLLIYVLISAILGSVVYQTVVAYAVHLGLPATDLRLVTAILVLVVVLFKITRTDDDLFEGAS